MVFIRTKKIGKHRYKYLVKTVYKDGKPRQEVIDYLGKEDLTKIKPNLSKEFIKEIPLWLLKNGRLYRSFKFKNFIESLNFVNSVGKLSEEEGHHPDIAIHYNKVENNFPNGV